MVKIIPYLLVKNGKEAIDLYKKLFNAEVIDHQPFSKEVGGEFGFPDDFDYESSTMHAELGIGGAEIYLSDNPTDRGSDIGSNVEIVLDLESKDQIEAIYNKAKEIGCEIGMELQKMFWGSYYARIKDPLGIGWQLNFRESE
ncbi:MAG: VOC family protein [Promethearchaeota archaeon]|jgi:PhnB protein